MTTIIAALIILAAAAGLILFLKNRNTARKDSAKNTPSPAAQAASQSPQSAPEADYKAVMDSLLRLNILLRRDAQVSGDLLAKIEEIIDDLIAITPAMMDRYPSETLTYEIKKIGSAHLFKTVKEYLDLSPENREKQADIFKRSIDSLHDVSRRARDIVEKNETAEFKTMANFLAGKFS